MVNRLGSNFGPSALEGKETLFASIFSAVWVLGITAYGLGYFGIFGNGVEPQGPVSLEIMIFALALILPLILVWMGVLLLRRTAEVQREARDLGLTIRKMQADPVGNRAARITPAGAGSMDAETKAKISALSGQMQQIEHALVAILNGQDGRIQITPTAPADPDNNQQDLPLDTLMADQVQPNWDELLQALNFPTDEKDKDGFRALRIAMRHRDTSLCIRAAEDIMNLLSQDGIYMDDFTPEIAPASLWRRFSEGTRGEEVAIIGGIHDEDAIEKTRNRMRSDTIFRDTALHFQRQFDVVLRLFIDNCTDNHIERLADTRTGRTFMLLGRVSGMFD